MDGSSAPWVYLIQDAGIKELAAPRKTIQMLRPIQVQQGDKRIALYPVGPLQGQLHDQLRPPAAAAPAEDDGDRRAGVRRRDRAGADVRLPEGSGNAAPARARARRLARERHRPRRDGRAESAAVRGRVRAPQDSGCRSAIWRWSATRFRATWSCTAAATRCTRRSPPSCCASATPGSSSRRGRPADVALPRRDPRPRAASRSRRLDPLARFELVASLSSVRSSRSPLTSADQPLVLEAVEAHEQAFLQVAPQLVVRHLRDQVLELAVDVLEAVVELAGGGPGRARSSR